ncbi:hypothetical protein KI387_029614, partial [Taxus chinensis]
RPGVHSEFELPMNQLNKPINSKPEEKLIPTTELEITNLVKGIPTLKNETN